MHIKVSKREVHIWEQNMAPNLSYDFTNKEFQGLQVFLQPVITAPLFK